MTAAQGIDEPSRKQKRKQQRKNKKDAELKQVFATFFKATTTSDAAKTRGNVITWELHPTAALGEERRQRRLRRRLGTAGADLAWNESLAEDDHESLFMATLEPPLHWFDEEQNAVYASIPELDDPLHTDNLHLQEFYRFRHLSRYERLYRLQHGIDLQPHWSGHYHFLNQDEDKEPTLDDPVMMEEGQRHRHHGRLLESTSTTTRLTQEVPIPAVRTPYILDDLTSSSSSSMDTWPDVTTTAAANTEGGQYNNYQAFALAQGYGTHFAMAWIGTPHPQRKTLIVDTGSHYTAFPCVGCRNCGAPHHTDPYFDPGKSDTFHQLLCDECRDGVRCTKSLCTFSQAYTEGSTWEATQVQDHFYCGGADVLDSVEPQDQAYAITFMFGCITKMTGLFITQLADGIAGFSAHHATLPKKLHEAKLIEHNMFAMCFRRELGTSKKGVTAGSMSLGGFSNNLDTSPMVYAKNVAKIGWFTVFVKNIYIRTGGGQSAKSTDEQQRTIKVNIDLKSINSGKGVIVDSGTTDTYLPMSAGKEFKRAWKKATGMVYSNSVVTLTREQLQKLPTVLIQCQAATVERDPSIDDYDSIPGYAGKLDPTSPNDLLIAIPATSYMDYSPITKKYMSRLYFTETAGGVLGSNTMQGHNVVFDWEHGRVGFAESSCTYDKKNVPQAALDNGFSLDCRISDPVLTTPCLDSVDQRLCMNNPTSIALLGKETWTAVVESPGAEGGTSCIDAAADVGDRNEFDPSLVVCDGRGVCQESRTCQLTCPEVKRAANIHPLPPLEAHLSCGDSHWSACDYGCYQTRIHSVAYSDGHCHEVSRETRTCHIGACARSDPCRVPFLVHVVLGFHGGQVSKWTIRSEEILATALTRVAARLSPSSSAMFGEGDVSVVSALKWTPDEMMNRRGRRNRHRRTSYGRAYFADSGEADSDVVGVRVVVEISIHNPSIMEETYNKTDRESLTNLSSPGEIGKPPSTCDQDTLFPLAKQALQTKKEIIQQWNFMPMLIDELKVIGETVTDLEHVSPFGLHGRVDESRVISAWTIRTQVGAEEEINFFGPPKPWFVRVLTLIHQLTLLATVVMLVFTLVSVIGACYEHVMEWDIRIFSFGKNRYRYATLSPSDDDSTVEDQIMGADSDRSINSPHYTLTRPKKRRNGR